MPVDVVFDAGASDWIGVVDKTTTITTIGIIVLTHLDNEESIIPFNNAGKIFSL